MYKFFKIILIIITICFSSYPSTFANNEKIKIGLLVPLSGEHKDNTGGADHYHADYVNPYWSKDMNLTTIIGTHLFYKAR